MSDNGGFSSYDEWQRHMQNTMKSVINDQSSDVEDSDVFSDADAPEYDESSGSLLDSNGEDALSDAGDAVKDALSEDGAGVGQSGLSISTPSSAQYKGSVLAGGDGMGSSSGGSNGSLLSAGSESGASGFSTGGSALQNAGGIFNAARNGLSNAASGALGALKSIPGMFLSKGKKGRDKISSSFGVSSKVATFALCMLTGGSIFGIAALFSNNDQEVVRLSDMANCHYDTYIDEYQATNGSGDHWSKAAAQSAAKTIHSALSAKDDIEFWTLEWNGSEYVKVKKKNEGFGFSDEAIAGMLANAYAESKIRADCYEMDYLVHDINETDDDGNNLYELGDVASAASAGNMSDFVLGRTHHSNWDLYCERMFELYGGGIDEGSYKWKSEDSIVHGNKSKYGSAGEAKAGLSGLYPGVGLWQWTGQRAYDLSRFADLQSDFVYSNLSKYETKTTPEEDKVYAGSENGLEDADQDGVNDIMYTIEGQLAFLYYENYGNFNTSPKLKPGECSNLANGTTGSCGVLEWGRQRNYKFKGKLGNDDGHAYKNMSFPTNDAEYKGKKQDVDVVDGENVYAGQPESKLKKPRDEWDPDEGDETTIRWPKFVVECERDDVIIGDGIGDEAVPTEFLSDEWEDGTLTQYITDYGSQKAMDNRVKELFQVDPYEYHHQYSITDYKIVLADKDSGGKDKGYWSITSEAEDLGYDPTIYYNKYQGNGTKSAKSRYDNDGYAGGTPNRSTLDMSQREIREGREFLNKELTLFNKDYYTSDLGENYDKGLYQVKLKYFRKAKVDNPDPDNDDDWNFYKLVTLDLKGDNRTKFPEYDPDYDIDDPHNAAYVNALKDEHRYEHYAPVSVLRAEMQYPKGKYIVADLTLAAGAESAVECARQFYLVWEGGPEKNAAMMYKHLCMAESFYLLMKTAGWTENEQYAKSILKMCDDNLYNTGLSAMYQSYVDMGCDPEEQAPDGIAACAVSWAWLQGNMSQFDYNDTVRKVGGGYKAAKCTSLYMAVHDAVLKGDPIYSSCDRGVCTAVRAAGADDDCPSGNASGIRSYFEGKVKSDMNKYEYLGELNNKDDFDNMQPGDLLLAHSTSGAGPGGGHVVVFVGEDLCKEKWTSIPACERAIVHSSFSGNPRNARGPRCDPDGTSLIADSRSYGIFRIKEYETNSKFKDAADMVFAMGYFDGVNNGAHYTPQN